MSTRTKYVLELTEEEAQVVIDCVQKQIADTALGVARFNEPVYETAATDVVAALRSVGLNGDEL